MKQNGQENTFILENSKTPSAVFLDIKEITKWSEKSSFVDKSGHQTTGFETSDIDSETPKLPDNGDFESMSGGSTSKIVTTMVEYHTSNIGSLQKNIENMCKCAVSNNKIKKTFLLKNTRIPPKDLETIKGVSKVEELTTTTLYYYTDVKQTMVSKLESKIKKMCQCEVEHDAEKRSFTLINSKLSGKEFMNQLQEITKYQSSTKFGNMNHAGSGDSSKSRYCH